MRTVLACLVVALSIVALAGRADAATPVNTSSNSWDLFLFVQLYGP